MDVAWTVPPDEEGEGRGRNVPRWQLTAGGVGELWRRVEEATELHSMDSLSLSLPLVRTLLHCGERWRTHSGLRPRVPRTHEALVAQLCLVLLIQYKVVWFFLPFPIKNMDKVSPVSSTVCIIKIYIYTGYHNVIVHATTQGYFRRWKFAKGDRNCCIFNSSHGSILFNTAL